MCVYISLGQPPMPQECGMRLAQRKTHVEYSAAASAESTSVFTETFLGHLFMPVLLIVIFQTKTYGSLSPLFSLFLPWVTRF